MQKMFIWSNELNGYYLTTLFCCGFFYSKHTNAINVMVKYVKHEKNYARRILKLFRIPIASLYDPSAYAVPSDRLSCRPMGLRNNSRALGWGWIRPGADSEWVCVGGGGGDTTQSEGRVKARMDVIYKWWPTTTQFVRAGWDHFQATIHFGLYPQNGSHRVRMVNK